MRLFDSSPYFTLIFLAVWHSPGRLQASTHSGSRIHQWRVCKIAWGSLGGFAVCLNFVCNIQYKPPVPGAMIIIPSFLFDSWPVPEVLGSHERRCDMLKIQSKEIK